MLDSLLIEIPIVSIFFNNHRRIKFFYVWKIGISLEALVSYIYMYVWIYEYMVVYNISGVKCISGVASISWVSSMDIWIRCMDVWIYVYMNIFGYIDI